MKAEAETGVVQLQSNRCQELLGKPEGLRRARDKLFPAASGESTVPEEQDPQFQGP